MKSEKIIASAKRTAEGGGKGDMVLYRRHLRRLRETDECDTKDACFAAKERLKDIFGIEE